MVPSIATGCVASPHAVHRVDDLRRLPVDAEAVRRIQERGAKIRRRLAAAVVGAHVERAAEKTCASPERAEQGERLVRGLQRLAETRVLIRIAGEGRDELERRAGRGVELILTSAAGVDAAGDVDAIGRRPAVDDRAVPPVAPDVRRPAGRHRRAGELGAAVRRQRQLAVAVFRDVGAGQRPAAKSAGIVSCSVGLGIVKICGGRAAGQAPAAGRAAIRLRRHVAGAIGRADPEEVRRAWLQSPVSRT